MTKTTTEPSLSSRESTLWLTLAGLRKAREYASYAKAPKAADAIRRAIKSTEGALRHVQGLQTRTKGD